MIPYPPYKIGWIVHKREITRTKQGRLLKRKKVKYYATIFLPNGCGSDTHLFDTYKEADKTANRIFNS